MIWLKAFHIIFLMTWFAGLFYLPRLFVYHAMSNAERDDSISNERFKTMERKLYYGIMTPGAVLSILSGVWMLYDYAWSAYAATGWLMTKLGLVVILIVYHLVCGHYVRTFRDDGNQHSHIFYRYFNEFPVLILVAVVVLVVVKPY